MKENIILKNRLKVARAENSLSQEQLASLVGVTRQTISSIETGQYCPTAKLALLISKELNKKFEELFYFEEEADENGSKENWEGWKNNFRWEPKL